MFLLFLPCNMNAVQNLYAMHWAPNDYNKIYCKHALTECSLQWGKKDFVGQLKLKQQLPSGAINFAIQFQVLVGDFFDKRFDAKNNDA